MKKAVVFSLFMFLIGFSATAQLGPSQGGNTPTLVRGMQVFQDFSSPYITVITAPNIVSLEIRDDQGQVVWTGNGGINRVDTSKWKEGDYYVVVVYPSGAREVKLIKIN